MAPGRSGTVRGFGRSSFTQRSRPNDACVVVGVRGVEGDAPVSGDPPLSGVDAAAFARRRETLTERVLAPASLSAALLTAPETVAWLAGYSFPFEDWPVADPFVGGPAAVVVDGDEMH